MRSEGNPLDLNNLPAAEDHYTSSCRDRDGNKLNSHDYNCSSSAAEEEHNNSREREKNRDGKDVEQELPNNNNKVYECRFCSLKFCKSQALGGHMNRHRQERETESLNKARQLVLSNDLAPATHLSYVSSGQYHHHTSSNIGGEGSFRSYHPAAASTRLFSNSSSSLPFNIPPPYMYTSPPRMLSFPTPNDYFMGHVLSPNTQLSNYTCIGAPVFTRDQPDLPMHNQDDAAHNRR